MIFQVPFHSLGDCALTRVPSCFPFCLVQTFCPLSLGVMQFFKTTSPMSLASPRVNRVKGMLSWHQVGGLWVFVVKPVSPMVLQSFHTAQRGSDVKAHPEELIKDSVPVLKGRALVARQGLPRVLPGSLPSLPGLLQEGLSGERQGPRGAWNWPTRGICSCEDCPKQGPLLGPAKPPEVPKQLV